MANLADWFQSYTTTSNTTDWAQQAQIAQELMARYGPQARPAAPVERASPRPTDPRTWLRQRVAEITALAPKP